MSFSGLRFPERIGWRDHVVGALLGAAYVGWLLATARSVGVPRDEGVYFRAAVDYVGWWRMLLEHGRDALRQGAIDAAWNINHEHPVLMKTLFGVSWWLFHEKWQLFKDATTSWRFPAMCMAGLGLWITYLFGARAYGRRAGLVAAALFGTMPQVFFHAHLACFDVPITTMWLACVYVHWRSLGSGIRRAGARGVLDTAGWAIAAGVVYGLALETKHNAWFLPVALVPHAAFVCARSWTPRPGEARRIIWPWGLLAMATIGPAVFYALWPYIWNDTRPRLEWYVNFHVNHEYYNIEFLGKNYFGPPSPMGYLPFLVVATVPAVTILLFFVGAFDRIAAGIARLRMWLGARGLTLSALAVRAEAFDPQETDVLIALAMGVAMGPFFLPKTPIFGGTKHWMPAYPMMALLAGRGFEVVIASMRRALPGLQGRRYALAVAGLVASVVVGPLAITAHAHPFGLSAYVPLVGGTAGGADLGLNRSFWGYTTLDAAQEYLDPQAPRGASVFISDTTWDAWARMQEDGGVRRDLRAAGSPSDAQLSLVQHELHMNEVDYSIWAAYGTTSPVHVVAHDGVPMVSIYRR